MTTAYPTALDSFTNPSAGDTLASPAHHTQHTNVNDSIVAIETRLGITTRSPLARITTAVAGTGADQTGTFHSDIVAAQAAGHDLYIPAGTYHCNIDETSITGLRIHGAGPSTILRPYDLTKPTIKLTVAIDHIELDHLYFDGRNADGMTKAPIYLEKTTWASIHDCTIFDASFRAIDFSNNLPDSDTYPPTKSRFWCERNVITQCALDAIFVGNVGDFWIRDNYISGVPSDTGIDGGQGGENGVITGNIIKGALTGIFMSDFTANMVITNNIITACTGNGIHVEDAASSYGSTNYIIADNIILGDGTGSSTGIHCGGLLAQSYGVPNGIIKGNYISNVTYRGIMLNDGCTGTLLANNVISSTTIALRLASSGVTVRDNVWGGGSVELAGNGVGTDTSMTFVNPFVGPFHPGLGNSNTTGTANTAYLAAFQVLAPVTVSGAWFRIAVASGNLDVGLYWLNGSVATRLASAGSTACPVAGVRKNVQFTASYKLVPGITYFVARAADNATASLGCATGTVSGGNPATMGGSIATSFPLPTSITLSSLQGDTLPMMVLE